MSRLGTVGILTPDMTDLSSVDLDHLAALARLSLTEDEKRQFATELPQIIAFVDQLQQVSVPEETPTKRVVDLGDLRADEQAEGLTAQQLAALADPAWRDGQVVVPAVFGEADNA